jgi:hypothetical protein
MPVPEHCHRVQATARRRTQQGGLGRGAAAGNQAAARNGEARARNGAAGALEEDARLTALFLWTQARAPHRPRKIPAAAAHD